MTGLVEGMVDLAVIKTVTDMATGPQQQQNPNDPNNKPPPPDPLVSMGKMLIGAAMVATALNAFEAGGFTKPISGAANESGGGAVPTAMANTIDPNAGLALNQAGPSVPVADMSAFTPSTLGLG